MNSFEADALPAEGARTEGDRVAAAVAAERERMAAILNSPHAKTKPALAVAIALAGTDVKAAEAILCAAAPEQTHGNGLRSKDAPGGLVLEGMAPAHDAQATNHGWDGVVAELNRGAQPQVRR